MTRILIILNILFSFSWSIGFQGLIIPQSGQILSTAGTGIAGDIDTALNPAMLKNDHPY